MKLNIYIIISFLLNFARHSSCWQYYTSLVDYTMSNSYKEPKMVHSEYRFGSCKSDLGFMLYAHVHLNHIQILGKLIVRGWLNINRIPTCILLRAKSFEEDTFRSTSFKFQICVPRITYCHSHVRYKYYYYEWYIPEDMVGGMDWEIYFYGPKDLQW